MYSIIGYNREIGITEVPTFIRLQPNGYYILCNESDAQGVVFDGAPYQLIGKPTMKEGLEQVCIVEINAGTRITVNQSVGKTNSANIDYMAMMTGVDIPTEDEDEQEVEFVQASMSASPMSIASPSTMESPSVVDDDIEHSPKFERVREYYIAHLWNKAMVHNAVGRWITLEEEAEILGENIE